MTDEIQPIPVGEAPTLDIGTRIEHLRQQVVDMFTIPRHLLPTYLVWCHRARFTEGRVLEPDPAATSVKFIQVLYWCPWSSLYEITVDGDTGLYLTRVEEVKHASDKP